MPEGKDFVRLRRKVQMKASEFITFSYLYGQGVEVFRWRFGHHSCEEQLPLTNRLYNFYTRYGTDEYPGPSDQWRRDQGGGDRAVVVNPP